MKVETNGKAKQTGPYMHWVVDNYCQDMIPYASKTLPELFDMLKNIPYRADPENIETLMRPLYTLNYMGYGGDCDDFAICVGCWAKLNKKPYRFIAVRKAGKKVLHHVFAQVYLNNIGWTTVDPTYKFNLLGCEHDRYVERVII